MSDHKQTEVTFKFYLPDNAQDFYAASNGSAMYDTLWEIDQMCRSVLKWEDLSCQKTRADLAEEIRSMINGCVSFENR